MRLWLQRALWITLPVTAGPALAAGLAAWSAAPRAVGGALCWVGWAVGLLATLAPRPIGVTALRVVAPAGAAAVLATVASGRPSTLASAVGVAAALVAVVLASDPAYARVAANALAYGDERRFPLRVPPALFAGPLPLARALASAGIAGGPLLLAAGELPGGVVALVVGWPVAGLALLALHRLSRRWLVLVPAGVVIVDPMALVDNVLFPREHVTLLRALAVDEAPGAALDLRFGATLGSLLLEFDEPAELVRAARPRRGAVTVTAPRLVVAVAFRADVLTGAARRRVRVQVTDPGTAARRSS